MKIRYVAFLLLMMCFLPSAAQDETKWEEYYQTFSDKMGFIKDLSVVDLLCNLGPEAGSYLKNHRNE